MNKPPLFFAHANGFPGSCYQQLFLPLAEHYTIDYIDCIGHQQQYPITDNWHDLVAEVVNYIQHHYQQPIKAVGHSLGGGLLYMAALKHPHLFEKIIMLDTPIFGRIKSKLLFIMKQLKYIDAVTPAKRTKGRRTHWPNLSSARQYFKSKQLFKNFTEQCLEDYLQYGMIKTGDELTLKFDAVREYHIFRTLPDHLPKYYRKQRTAVGVLVGKQTDVLSYFDIVNLKRRVAKVIDVVDGSHMFPFEFPQLTAKAIINMMENKL